MIVTSTTVQWNLDSRALKHFTGVKSDIQQMKRWNKPWTIWIANGATVTAEGYGTIHLRQLNLIEVWYVPAFKNIRLLSIKSLALDGHTIAFEGDTTTCLKHGDPIFEACIDRGTYCNRGSLRK